MDLELPLSILAFLFGIGLFAGVVKGVVGFSMPMILMSGISAVLPPETALAALIFPTVVTNLMQATRFGTKELIGTVQRYWRLLVTVLLLIAVSSQLIVILPDRVLFALIGIPVVLFTASQLAGWTVRIPPDARNRSQVLAGVLSGFFGGFSGIWGPPVIAYLSATDTPKAEAIRVQGIVYGSGAVVLLGSHLRTGVVDQGSAILSAGMLVPTALGMLLGFRLHDRLDQARFRTVTLVVLFVAGLNLVRRAVM